jgi:hypothetical protein
VALGLCAGRHCSASQFRRSPQMRRGDAVWPRPALPYSTPLVARGQAARGRGSLQSRLDARRYGEARPGTKAGCFASSGSLQFVRGPAVHRHTFFDNQCWLTSCHKRLEDSIALPLTGPNGIRSDRLRAIGCKDFVDIWRSARFICQLVLPSCSNSGRTATMRPSCAWAQAQPLRYRRRAPLAIP